MASVTEIKDRFVNLLTAIGDVIMHAYKDTEGELIDLNRSQMMDGSTATGKNIGEYSAFTKEIKAAKGQQTQWVTLFDEGDFQRAMKIETLNEQFVTINSSDWKTEKLTNKYGNDIFGLTPANTKIYARENWLFSFVNKIKDYIYGRN